jgi:hypothetical protein
LGGALGFILGFTLGFALGLGEVFGFTLVEVFGFVTGFALDEDFDCLVFGFEADFGFGFAGEVDFALDAPRPVVFFGVVTVFGALDILGERFGFATGFLAGLVFAFAVPLDFLPVLGVDFTVLAALLVDVFGLVFIVLALEAFLAAEMPVFFVLTLAATGFVVWLLIASAVRSCCRFDSTGVVFLAVVAFGFCVLATTGFLVLAALVEGTGLVFIAGCFLGVESCFKGAIC